MEKPFSQKLLAQRILLPLFLALLASGVMAQTDYTSSIVNPNFDGLSFSGWQQMGMGLQTNSEFPGKSNHAYAERWVSKENNLPDTYIRQTLSGLPKGRYMLTVAAQHVKQGSTSAATGGTIFADWKETTVTSSGDYTLTFDLLTDDVTIGFKCEGSTANWMACDNFRLSLVSNDVAYLRSGLSDLVSQARTIANQSMSSEAKNALSTALSTASGLTTSGDVTSIASAANTLKSAMLAAERSIFATKVSATGSTPTVTTQHNHARGATMIFGRISVSSSASILEQGLCYSSTNPEPTVADERTTRYVSNGGNIYCIDNVTPGTLYYVRGYAVTTGYKVGYGDVIRVYTLPKGNITWNYDNEGDNAQNARISQAVSGAMNYWNNLTSISGFHLSAHYSYGAGAGDGTADCSYGGWMRISQNVAYQATGTVLHEGGHGIGVGTTNTYYGDIRSGSSSGVWYGKRATRFLQFWDNSSGIRLTGDGTHLWSTNAAQNLSYTINGAHEDAHSDVQYYGNALLMQAIVEDGLFPVENQLQGLAYTFEHSDDATYYLRNSDSRYGLKSSFLVDNGGKLQLRELSISEAATASNNAQWSLSFDPSQQLYRLKNKSTGRYIQYSTDNATDGFKASSGTSGEIDLRLQLSFADVTMGSGSNALTLDCYHVMRRNATPSPQALCAVSSTATGSTAFSNTLSATAQRWLILTDDQLSQIDAALRGDERANLDDLIAHIRSLAGQSHTEKVEGTDETLETTLVGIESREAGADASTLVSLQGEAKTALMTFLQHTTPQGAPYDLTFLIADAGMDGKAGWEGTSPTISHSCGEYYQKVFDVYQTINGAPSGRYEFKVQAFQRPGTATDTYTDYVNGSGAFPVTTQVYLGTSHTAACHIGRYAQSSKVGVGSESEVGSPVKYIPNNMEAASAYFARNLYDNSVETTLESNNQTLRFGIRGASYVSYDWTIFDNFRLYYHGGSVISQDPASEADGYDITTAMAPYLCTGSLKDWTTNGMVSNYNAGSAPYTNSADGSLIDFPFIERWTSSANGGHLADTNLSQTITELPNGKYYIRASLIAVNQSSPSTDVSGVTFWAGNQEMSVATGDGLPERYSLLVEVSDGTLTYGLRATNTSANWIAIDNISLIYCGTEEEYFALATPCHPIRVPVGHSTFDHWNLDGWTQNGTWGTINTTYDHFNPPFAESWVRSTNLSDRSLTQTLSLPKGYYTLQAAVEAVRQDQPSLEVSGVSLRIDDTAVGCHTADGAPEFFTVGEQLEEGEHTIGLYVSGTNANWVAIDNVVLRYYGLHRPLAGDINNDGYVTITDVTMLVDNILDPTNHPIETCLSDLNSDELITVADVTYLVDIILAE